MERNPDSPVSSSASPQYSPAPHGEAEARPAFDLVSRLAPPEARPAMDGFETLPAELFFESSDEADSDSSSEESNPLEIALASALDAQAQARGVSAAILPSYLRPGSIEVVNNASRVAVEAEQAGLRASRAIGADRAQILEDASGVADAAAALAQASQQLRRAMDACLDAARQAQAATDELVATLRGAQ